MLCEAESLFVQVTVPPAATVTVSGLKAKPDISTSAEDGAVVAGGVGGVGGVVGA
jgi:hypothetical protein